MDRLKTTAVFVACAAGAYVLWVAGEGPSQVIRLDPRTGRPVKEGATDGRRAPAAKLSSKPQRVRVSVKQPAVKQLGGGA